MGSGTHSIGTIPNARFGAGVLGKARRVRLPGRPPAEVVPQVRPETEAVARRAFPEGAQERIPRKWLTLVASLAVSVLGLLVAAPPAVAGTTFTVTNTNDAGAGSLRQAILDANETPNGPGGADAIHFDIPGGGIKTISPVSRLPAILKPVVIDGYTQPGASPNTLAEGNNANLLIELSGQNLGTTWLYEGLVIYAPDTTVRGLVINRFSDAGIFAWGAGGIWGGLTVEGNYIGTDASGTVALGNGRYSGTEDTIFGDLRSGVAIVDSEDSTVGGTSPGARNVISGNGASGVKISQSVSSTVVQGNYIGTDRTGEQRLSNGGDGVLLHEVGENNVVGGTSGDARNVISGNGASGVRIVNEKSWSVDDASDNKVSGNYIGTDKDGEQHLGNNFGVRITDAPNNTVGGTTSGERNVISDSAVYGILIEGEDARGNEVSGNYVGTDKDGEQRLGNNFAGVQIYNAPGNTVGGTTPGAGNVISGNYTGVSVFGRVATGNAVLSNSVYANDKVGIDLDDDVEVTPNDAGDGDTGSNNLQNFPVIESASNTNGATTVTGALDSTPNETFTVQVFRNSAAVGPDPSGHGEGETFVASATVTTDAGGNGSFAVTDTGGSVGDTYAATATSSANDTSEFSAAIRAEANTAPTVALSASNPTTVDEGQTTRTYSFAIEDPDADDSFAFKTGSPSCGTGGTMVGTPSITGKGGSFGCRFPDGPADPTVRVQVTDSDGAASNSATQGVTVNNAAPTITAVTNDGPVDEGSRASITVAATDPGNDTLSYFFDCNGDGDYDAATDAGPQQGPSASCSFDDDGVNTVNARVTDGDPDGSATGSTTVAVRNAAPTATFNVPAGRVDEGSGFEVSLTGPNDPSGADRQAGFEYDFDCGSGYDAVFDPTTTATCPTTDDGLVTVKGRVRDKDGGVTEYTGTVTVNNVAPTVTLQGPGRVNESATAERTYAFTAADPGRDNIIIEVGCGANGEVVDSNGGDPGGTFAFDSATGEGSFGCVFPDGGPDGLTTSDVSVQATDSDGASDDASRRVTVVTVDNVAPTVELSGQNPLVVDESATAGRAYSYTVRDAGGDTVAAVDTSCGEGGRKVEGSDELADASGSFECVFPDGPGTSTVGAAATDSDGGKGEVATQTVKIDNVAPAVEVSGDATADEGQEKPFDLGSFGDPGLDGPWWVTVDWGDGAPPTTFESRMPGSLGQQSHGYAGSRAEPYTVTVTVNEAADGEVAADAAEGAPPSGSATFEVAVGNAAPVAGDDGPYVTREDRPLQTPAAHGVLENDSDPGGDRLVARLVRGPAHGKVTLDPDGTFSYAPARDYAGPSSFTYKACDAEGACSGPATARLSVTPVNDPPLARDDSYVTSEDEGRKARAPGILRNDSDPEREKLAASVVSRPRHGQLRLRADGSFVYRPRANYNGRDSFSYRASDGKGGADVARVTIRVRPVADGDGGGSAGGGSGGGAGAGSTAGGGSAAG